MRRIVDVILFLMMAGFFTGCTVFNSNDEADGVFIRIVNTSSVPFESVLLRFPKDEATFGRIMSGRSSEYKEFDQAYRYGFIKVTAQNESFILQPVDYVGEEALENGKYTFRLSIDEEHLTLEFRKD